MIVVLFTLAFWLGASELAFSQEASPSERAKLRRAEQAADYLIRRFRETLDFGIVWKELRPSNAGPALLALIMAESAAENRKEMDAALAERGFVALANLLHLKSAYDLSVAKIGSGVSEEELTPKEIQGAERANIYIKTNGKEPRTVSELKEYISEAEVLARLYRKHLSRASFETAAYKENLRYLAEFFKTEDDKYRIAELDKDFGLGKDVKEFRVTRGAFYYAFIEENGEMKLIGFGMGN